MEWFKRLVGKEDDLDKKVNDKLQEFMNSEAFNELLENKATQKLREERENRQKEETKKRKEAEKKIEETKKNLNYLSKELKNSSEPHVKLVSGKFSKENGLEVELDWNDAFIRYLKANGIEAENDEETVRKWLAALSRDIDRQVTAENYLMSGIRDDEEFEGNFRQLIEHMGDDEEESNS